MKVAAVDQGTSSSKVLIWEGDGPCDVICSFPHQQFSKESGWMEQDPAELLANVKACIQAARDADGKKLDALGLANQGESCLAWDAITLEPLTAVVSWQDTRTRDDVARMRDEGAEEHTVRRAGLPLNAYFSASKLRWLLQYVPAVQRARDKGRLHLGTTDAFLIESLTGEFRTDVTTASRTSLMNMQTLEWDPMLCGLFDVPVEALPEIRSTVDDFGNCQGVRITASVVDQQAALYGHGCRKVGDAKMTFGTGGFLLAISEGTTARQTAKGLVPTVAWRIGQETTFALEGGVMHAGSAVAWLRGLGAGASLDKLRAGNTQPAIARDMVFIPAFSGLGCPHWDSSAVALWAGLNLQTTATDLCQSVLEGIAFRSAEVMKAAEDALGEFAVLSIDGGMSSNDYFVQMLADASHREIRVPANHNLTAQGCAELAAMGVGVTLQKNELPDKCYRPRAIQRGEWWERFYRALERSRNQRHVN